MEYKVEADVDVSKYETSKDKDYVKGDSIVVKDGKSYKRVVNSMTVTFIPTTTKDLELLTPVIDTEMDPVKAVDYWNKIVKAMHDGVKVIPVGKIGPVHEV